MNCKECDSPRPTARWAVPSALVALVVPACLCAAGPLPTVHLWPTAVVVDEQVRLGELCELTGFEAGTHERLRDLVVAPSPPPGGSRAVTLRDLRGVLTGAGMNMAETIVKGAAECGVSRPSLTLRGDGLPVSPAAKVAAEQLKEGPMSPAPVTLRDAVVGYFQQELSRYEGRVQVDFGRDAAVRLDLAGPEYTFEIRRRSNRPLGLIDIEVDVLRDGQRAQQVRLQPIVSFSRKVVVARRAINQGAEVRPEDVHLLEMAFERLDRLGMADLYQAIGQRAKRFIRPATVLDPRDLERVPLVKRGQLVTVWSAVGGVTVQTAAKAAEPGGYGDAVELRDAQRRGRRLIGVVTGPRQVELRGDDGCGEADGDRLLAGKGDGR